MAFGNRRWGGGLGGVGRVMGRGAERLVASAAWFRASKLIMGRQVRVDSWVQKYMAKVLAPSQSWSEQWDQMTARAWQRLVHAQLIAESPSVEVLSGSGASVT